MHDLESHDHVESGASLLKAHQAKLGQLLLVGFALETRNNSYSPHLNLFKTGTV